MPNDLRVTEVPATGTREIVVLQNIHKRFGSTHAVNDVSTRFGAGEVHALLGENGAGKSTLGKIVGGLFPPDEGRLLLDGAEVQYRNIAEARSRGVAMVFQELSLVPDLTVRENICLGMENRTASVKSAGKAQGNRFLPQPACRVPVRLRSRRARARPLGGQPTTN
jgi:ribose transport system ATP-binding protein